MRFGIIDLGTNSVRFDVYEVDDDGNYRRLYREKLMVRLGDGLFAGGKLKPDAVERSCAALKDFTQTAQKLGVARINAVATSALRDATDAAAFVQRVKTELGLQIKVIDGLEEARLIAQGIVTGDRSLKGNFALIDIGGGSTEISLCRNKTVLKSFSLNLGSARLQQLFLSNLESASARETGISEIRAHISRLCKEQLGTPPRNINLVIGSSGSIRSLAKLANGGVATEEFSREDLGKTVAEMASMNRSQLTTMPGMDPNRVDMILAAGVLLEELMDFLDAKEVRLTEFSLKEGLLAEELKKVAKLAPRVSTAKLSGGAQSYCAHPSLGISSQTASTTQAIAGDLFDKLKRLHGLGKRWREHLLAAVAYKDVGEIIDHARHSEHSCYIVRNLDFRYTESWEQELVAQLCLWHADHKPKVKNPPFAQEPDKQRAFFQLLAILRVVDALESTDNQHRVVDFIKLDRGALKIRLRRRKSSTLHALKVEQKKKLFEAVFNRPIVLEGLGV